MLMRIWGKKNLCNCYGNQYGNVSKTRKISVATMLYRPAILFLGLRTHIDDAYTSTFIVRLFTVARE